MALDLEDIRREVAKSLTKEAHIKQLGKYLGFSVTDIERYIATNLRFQKVTYEGTSNMLKDWSQGVTVAEEGPKLREALLKAGFRKLASRFFPGEVPSVDVHQRPTNTQFVERNPQNQQKGNGKVSDKELQKLAEAIGDNNKLHKLGLELGYQHPQIREFMTTNRGGSAVSNRGTTAMLFDWKERTHVKKNQRALLMESLGNAELAGLTEILNSATSVSDPQESDSLKSTEEHQPQARTVNVKGSTTSIDGNGEGTKNQKKSENETKEGDPDRKDVQKEGVTDEQKGMSSIIAYAGWIVALLAIIIAIWSKISG